MPFALIAASVAAVAVAGCGGGERQDANEPSGTFQVAVVDASFPAKQHLAKSERFVIAVQQHRQQDGAQRRGDGRLVRRALRAGRPRRPDARRCGSSTPARAAATPPTPTRGPSARLAPGQTRRFVWRVTAVQAGTHTVKWQVAAGLNGKAKATLAGNRAPAGSVTVDVSAKPAQAHVDPKTGRVVRDGQ